MKHNLTIGVGGNHRRHRGAKTIEPFEL